MLWPGVCGDIGFSQRTQRQAKNVGNTIVAMKRAGATARVSKDAYQSKAVSSHAEATTPARSAWSSLSSTWYDHDTPRQHRLVLERVHTYKRC